MPSVLDSEPKKHANVENVKALFCFVFLGFALSAYQTPDLTPQDEPTKFRSTLNVVLVPVLVRDASGRAVGTLHREDFQVFDDNKLQTLTGFTVQRRTIISGEERRSDGSANATPEVAFGTTVPDRFIIFLFDDLHLSENDLVFAQEAGAKILSDSLAKTDAGAVFSISGKTNSGITRDHDKLIEAIRSMRAQSIGGPIGHRCPDVGYYQADLIINKGDALALKAAVKETEACSNLPASAAENRARAAASESLNLGNQNTHITLEMIKFIVQKMGALPGQRTLILVSPGFLTSDALDQKSDIINVASQTSVIISALNARGLYGSDLKANDSISTTTTPDMLRTKTGYNRDSLSADGDVMAELADGTGGTYFHNSNDLGSGFQKLVRSPEYLYLLEFTPGNNKKNGSYHRLRVKIDQSSLTLQARQGYYERKRSDK